jgi:phosphonate transport system ATP-binding protein
VQACSKRAASVLNILLQHVTASHPAAKPQAAPALRGLDIAIASGEQVAIIGPSGAGKTTLLQVMGCTLQPSQGQVRLNDVEPWRLSTRQLQQLRGQLFVAPQVPPLPPRQRVVTSVLAARLPAMGFWASIKSLFYPSDIPSAFEALDRFDVADKLFDRVDRLSGGERQRVGLARALLAPASFWLVDEPLSALDPTRSRLAIETLTQEARALGVTLVATLHQVDVAIAHFPRVIGMREGQVAFDLPASKVTQGLLAALYDQFEHELRGEVHVAQAPDSKPAPVVMHCR